MISRWWRQVMIGLKVRGWYPETRIARLAVYSLLATLGSEILAAVFTLVKWSGAATQLSNLGSFLIFLLVILLGILGVRWLKRNMLWRLRNRLIVTYVFIGVIPLVLLATMAGVAFYLFAGQFANFLVTSSVDEQLEGLRTASVVVAHEISAHGVPGKKVVPYLTELKATHPEWSGRIIEVWSDGKQVYPEGASAMDLPDFILHPADAKDSDFRSLTNDHGALFLRSAASIPDHGARLTVVVSEPFNKALLEKISAGLGQLSLFTVDMDAAPPAEAKPPAGTLQFKRSEADGALAVNGKEPRLSLTAGTVPAAARLLDVEIPFGTPLAVADWMTGERNVSALMQIRTRPSLLYGKLFAALGQFSSAVEYALFGIAIFFALIELAALFVGLRLSRTITGSVANLYDATEHVNQGDFSHRIAVQSDDQLAELQMSFNAMTQSIERLIVEQKEKQRLENELTIAQEVQSQLFPQQASGSASLEVFGFCRPARTVSGDYYDFLTLNSDRVCLAVGDISGKGISAALLMATIHSAVRAYSLEAAPLLAGQVAAGSEHNSLAARANGVSSGELLTLLNHQLFHSTPSEKYATMFVGFYDGATRRLTYSNGGHLPPAVMAHDGSVRMLDTGGTVVGLFPNCCYPEATVALQPGDLFIAWSDGVTEPENDFGEFGEQRLLALVREHRHEPLARISEIVTAAVDDWIGANEQPDDVTLVLARAR